MTTDMLKTSQYPVSWLDCRYPFDEKGRNEGLEGLLLNRFNSQRALKILDLGAGNGANYKYYSPRLKADQQWTCMEIDPLLVAELEKTGKGDIRVLQAPVEEMEQRVDISGIDLILANALFDLFSEGQFKQVITPVVRRGIPFLFTMNYTGMLFSPFHPHDSRVTSWYHAHMKRKQSFGIAMGADGAKKMMEILGKMGIEGVKSGKSTWMVQPSDRQMLSYLVSFIMKAVPELELSRDEKNILKEWGETRVAQIEKQELRMEVIHEDLLWLA